MSAPVAAPRYIADMSPALIVVAVLAVFVVLLIVQMKKAGSVQRSDTELARAPHPELDRRRTQVRAVA